VTDPLYSFDTSVWINGRRDLLPPDLFPTLWSKIEGVILSGGLRSVDVVKEELSKKDDATATWATSQSDLFVPLGRGGGRNAADPFVVGLALARSGIVVTQEVRSRSLDKPKIPDVCSDLQVRCIPLVEVVRDLGWTF
jgi:hypothetical protein